MIFYVSSFVAWSLDACRLFCLSLVAFACSCLLLVACRLSLVACRLSKSKHVAPLVDALKNRAILNCMTSRKDV